MKKVAITAFAFLMAVASVSAYALPKDDKASHELPFEQVAGDNGDYKTLPNDPPPAGTFRIEVDITNQITTVYRTDTGAIVRQCLCSTGTTKTPTPLGTYSAGKIRYRSYAFGKSHTQYASQVMDDICFHSILYSKKNAATYSPSYKNLGTRQSHGCIRLPVPDARWIYYNMAPGTQVTFTNKIPRNEALRESLKLPPVPKVRPKDLSRVPQIYADGTTGYAEGAAK